MGLALGVVHGPLAGLLVLVAHAVGVVQLGSQGGDFVLDRNRPVDIGLDVSVPTALDNRVALVSEYAGIQHDGQGNHRGGGAATAAYEPGPPLGGAE